MARTSFGKFAVQWDRVATEDVKRKMPTVGAVFSLLGTVKKKTIYEIACGNGFLSRTLVEKGAKEVWASDIAPELIDIATKKYPHAGIRYHVREASDFKGIPRAHFDAVIVHQGMFHVRDVDALLKGIARILKPDGMFIFTLLHPLYPDAYKAMGDDLDVYAMNKKYLRIYSTIAHKKWNGDNVSYLLYKRPLSFYINICGTHGLTIDAIEEPPSRTMRNGKMAKTTIPSSIIIRAIKI